MTRKPSNSTAEAHVVSAALTDDSTIPVAIGKGLVPDDFSVVGLGWCWEGLTDLWRSSEIVRLSTLRQWLRERGRLTDRLNAALDTVSSLDGTVTGEEMPAGLPITPADEMGFWTDAVIECAIRRQELEVSAQLNQMALNRETAVDQHVTTVMELMQSVSQRWHRLRHPVIGNPADELAGSERWFTATGLPFMDNHMLLPSQELHVIAGDPGCGKTTSAIQVAAHNIKNAVPVAIIVAESDAVEYQLGMLAQTKAVTSAWLSRIMYDYRSATEENLAKIRELWDEHFGGLPLRIFEVTKGVEEVISIVESLEKPHLVIVDHAFNVVKQTPIDPRVAEHMVFARLFSGLKAASKRGNHVTIVYNQYKLAGREDDDERGPDAEYGGSVIQNVAGSITHLWLVPDDDLYAATGNGFRLCMCKFWKARAQLRADERGNPIDPRGMTTTYWLDGRHRRITDKLPEA